MKVGVVIFPGSNCDGDTIHVLRNVFDFEVVELWHKDKDLKNVEIVFIPGGFSFGDYLRAGAVARFSPVMESVIEFANKGGYVVGICNGFQVLCESGLLPGVLLRNEEQRFICKNVYIKSETEKSMLTESIKNGKVLKIPIAHAEGRYYIGKEGYDDLILNDQILFKYCDKDGNINKSSNPNGSLENIAGICNLNRNVFGMMPHPERASESILGNIDGSLIFNSLINHFQVV